MKRYLVAFGVLLLALLTACSMGRNSESDNVLNKESEWFPYRSLEAEEIKDIKILAIPPDKEVGLTQEQISECVGILQKFELEKRVSSEILSGQMVKVVITKKDGSRMEIQDMSPYFVMDGVWYTGKGSGDELNRFANEIITSSGV